MIEIVLPFPDKRLNPNRANGRHYSAVASIKKKVRCDTAIIAKVVANGLKFDLNDICIKVTFVYPDKRHRDLDNLYAACKAMVDGIADGLGINDKQFHPVILMR